MVKYFSYFFLISIGRLSTCTCKRQISILERRGERGKEEEKEREKKGAKQSEEDYSEHKMKWTLMLLNPFQFELHFEHDLKLAWLVCFLEHALQPIFYFSCLAIENQRSTPRNSNVRLLECGLQKRKKGDLYNHQSSFRIALGISLIWVYQLPLKWTALL